MNISAANGLDKTLDLTEAHARLVTQLNARVAVLRNGYDHRASRHPQREIDAWLAEAARVSVRHVRTARRLACSSNADLIVAALLQLIPITTALRGVQTPRPNARHLHWQHVVSLCR